MIPSNPADRATPPALSGSTVSAPAVADVRRLIGAAEESSPVLALAIVLAAVTGARRGELCALRWSDVEVAANGCPVLAVYRPTGPSGAFEPFEIHVLEISGGRVAAVWSCRDRLAAWSSN